MNSDAATAKDNDDAKREYPPRCSCNLGSCHCEKGACTCPVGCSCARCR